MVRTFNLISYAGFVAHAAAACTRASLQTVTNSYLQAQAAGKPSLLALSADVTYIENDVKLDITKGVLSQALTVDFNRSLYDTTECVTFTEVVLAATSKHPYVIHTRLVVVDSSVTKIESVVTDDGDWVFNAAGYLSWTKQETWTAVAEAKRDSRATIKAAGDAYLDQWGKSTLPVPFNTPCARLEGGSYTGQRNPASNSCAMPAFPQPLNVTSRRYVIDEELGAVDIFNDFPWLEKTKPNGTPSSNQIRVEGGKIRYIHEITVCATPRCGR